MCNADGRVGEDICNAETGVCDCKDNVIGDKCSYCEMGHYSFPDCKGDSYFCISSKNTYRIKLNNKCELMITQAWKSWNRNYKKYNLFNYVILF